MSFLPFIFTGLFCGFIDGCLGMGFGVTSASVLVTFGVAPAVASASIHTAETVVDVFSAISLSRARAVYTEEELIRERLRKLDYIKGGY